MSNLISWLPAAANSGFDLNNLPYGVFSTSGLSPRAGVALGDSIIDLAAAHELGLLKDNGSVSFRPGIFAQSTLNEFIELGNGAWASLRTQLQDLFGTEGETTCAPHKEKLLVKQTAATMHLPVHVGDYTDFYSSIEHASNIGSMFRDPENPLLPNWRHIPVGYHGRASSIVVSGTDVRRPTGQIKPLDSDSPVYSPSKRLDFELEMAFVVGRTTELGSRIAITDAEDAIFGALLFNDWSARDIQKWEYVPLGPFLGKSFVSSVAPWIVPMAALEPFRVAGPSQEPAVLPYLQAEKAGNFDVNLSVELTPQGGKPATICETNFKYMYWSMAQQLTHHTVNGCNVRVGDMMASGTISGKEPGSYGSMLELSWGGKNPIPVSEGTRYFLEDGDTLTMRGVAEKGDLKVSFGEVSGTITPAR